MFLYMLLLLFCSQLILVESNPIKQELVSEEKKIPHEVMTDHSDSFPKRSAPKSNKRDEECEGCHHCHGHHGDDCCHDCHEHEHCHDDDHNHHDDHHHHDHGYEFYEEWGEEGGHHDQCCGHHGSEDCHHHEHEHEGDHHHCHGHHCCHHEGEGGDDRR